MQKEEEDEEESVVEISKICRLRAFYIRIAKSFLPNVLFFCVKNENFCSLFVFQTARFAFCFESFSGE